MAERGPWNPGLLSDIPRAYLGLSTILRQEHVSTSLEEVLELRSLTGLEFRELVAWRPRRLMVHELLVRITADLLVPAGDRVEDLGIHFRRMADQLLAAGIEASLPAFEALHSDCSRALDARLSLWMGMLTVDDPPVAPAAAPTGFWSRLLGRSSTVPGRAVSESIADGGVHSDWDIEERVVAQWAKMSAGAVDSADRIGLRALLRIAAVARAKLGGLAAQHDLVRRLAHRMALNELASDAIGEAVGRQVHAMAAGVGFVLLPAQPHPVVLNTKGSSASGKSTLRLQQRELVRRMGLAWEDFAVISPDIWRKYLLDYDSLGEAAIYAGSLTGLELELIDRKLDRYMARKAEQGRMTHLLIDRFRFDSFALDSDEAGSNLLTRFGHQIFMFFMITPPHETVVRAWHRGLEFGRFKPVDDLLAHNVEAYTGMPELFFTWALSTEKVVHFEFLDNSVPKGQRPKTMAFGCNGHLVLLDPMGFMQIDRYRHINFQARSAEAVYPADLSEAPTQYTHFLRACLQRIPRVDLASAATGEVYAQFEFGQLRAVEPRLLREALSALALRAGVSVAAPALRPWLEESITTPAPLPRPKAIAPALTQQTLGVWGFP
jgi:hypothetical protein